MQRIDTQPGNHNFIKNMDGKMEACNIFSFKTPRNL
jgi:hypothetical protein